MVVKTNRQTFQRVMANKKKGGKATEALKKELEKKKLKEEEEEMELEDSDDEMDEEDSDFDSDLDDEEDEDEDESLEEESEDEKPAKGKNALATKSPGKTETPVQKKQDKLLTPAQKKKAETPKGKGQTPVAKKGMKIKEMEEQEDDDDDGDEDDESFEDEDESGEDKKVVKEKPMTPAQKKIQGKQQMSAQKKFQGKADTPSQKKTETPKGVKRKGQDVKDQNAKKAKGLEDDDDEEEDDDDDDDDDESFEEDEDEESEEEKPVKGKKSLTPAQKKKQEMSAQKKIQGKADTPSLKKNEKTETPKGVKRKRQDDAGVDAKKTKDLDEEAHRLTEERIRERNSRTLFIGQLPPSTTVDEVKALSPDITICRIPMRSNRKGSVYAFVEFSSEKKAEENYEKLQKKTVSGKQIVIDYTGEKSSNYKKSPIAKKAIDKKVLFIGGVASDITVEDLAKVFPGSAQVDIVNPPGSYSGRNVYVKFDTEEAAKEAFSKAGNLKVKGSSLTVLFAHVRMKPKNVKPRRKDFGKRLGPKNPKFQTKKEEESDNDSDDE